MPTNYLQSCTMLCLISLLSLGLGGCAQQDFPRSKPPPVATAPPAQGRVPSTQVPDDKPRATTLVSEELETNLLEGFKKFYVSRAASPPRAFISFRSEIPDNGATPSDGLKRITEPEVQPYLTRPLRRAGVLVYDKPPNQIDLQIEIVVSVRRVSYFAPEGNSTNEIPDIRLIARRASDTAIVGQSSTFELLGTTKAWSVYRRVGDRELLRATVLSLMEDMIINASEGADIAVVKDFKEFQWITKNEYFKGGISETKKPPLKEFQWITKDEYFKGGTPLAPLIKKSFQARAERSIEAPAQ